MFNPITPQPYGKYFTAPSVRIPPGRLIQFRFKRGQSQVVIVIVNEVGPKTILAIICLAH